MKKKIVIGSILLLVVGMVPFETTFVSEMKVRFADPAGNPFVGVYVAQTCRSLRLNEYPCQEHTDSAQKTDQDGYVYFPRRTIRASLFSRVAESIVSIPLIFTVGEYWDDGFLAVTGPNGVKIINFNPSGPLPTEIILDSKKAN